MLVFAVHRIKKNASLVIRRDSFKKPLQILLIKNIWLEVYN